MITAVAEITDCATVDATLALLELRNNLESADFWRAAEGARWKSGSQQIVSIFVGADCSYDLGDDVHNMLITFNRHVVEHLDCAILTHSADIVARKVDEHEVFGLLFLVG